MSDLLDTPLSASEVERLPEKLRRRYWAAEISHGVEGLSALDRQQVRHECRCLLAWLSGLEPGSEARYVGVVAALKGKRCRVEAVAPDDVSIAVPGLADLFLVNSLDLEPIR